MRKKGKVVAVLLATGLTLTTIFPQTAYAAEVGSQIKEANASVSSVLEENRDLLETAVKEAVLARDGDVSDQILMDQARSEIVAKIQSGEMTLKADTVKEDGLKETDSNPVEVVDYTSADEMISDEKVSEEKTATRLIVTSDAEPTDFFDAVSVDHYDDIWVFTYETAETTDKAYNSFASAGYIVEKDFSVEAIKEDETPDEEIVPEITDTEVDDTTEDTVTEERKTIIAVIDTGISDVTNDDVFKDRIIEGTSVISDSYVDDNGHGTTMAKIIAEDTADEPDVMILPIKALDENGRGTVLSVALAIKYAKEHGADVINLSLSGVGQSNVLTNAINDCYNNGITVVTAAGNDNADAKDYIPGNVDTAINVAAADEDTDGKIISASYTNHGDNVDFAAIGTCQLSIEKEEVSLETELRGTSIASAHVAAYVALLKQIDTQVSETDIMESLKASTVDLGEEGFDPYFGNGFLTKENLVFLKSDVEDQDKDTGADETEDDRNQKIEVATKKTIFIDQNHWWGSKI